ncbi:bifunctional riboflavin kinase/FAD synthetase [Clostridium sp. CX1]|uniref:Riboflavin biosynthesis protein n=1 Tax=Clostridium tanneri TaxID=3037988 RepID=A0ABU4JS77_9CLOT|nr:MULTISPECIES: bifunctional riboflavin kinase/FAD synthetase [unclassified Clostridium]MCT8976812.1 bifunctional riboflavin kinase/FAD synthetase [Clostridium sp. CX1]MDW8801017.1 bifunctional riboflavin kinase/FAD synthetase [Clostridium sp. A1-XYC3]
MVIIEDSFKQRFEEDTYIALGSFDGLHIGHMSLINKTIKLAKKNNAKSMIFTFKNHPLMTINTELAPKLIMDNNSKINVLKSLGVDIINMVDFNKDFMKMTPEDFVINLVSSYKAKGIIVGFNYRFGYKNQGDVELLKKMSKNLGFTVQVIDPVKSKGNIVSSSFIRNIISDEGDIKKANKLLTRPFMIEGAVVKGKQLGRTLGFPTVNLDYDKKFLLPRGGVYYTVVEYKKRMFKGITDVGYNPTTEDNKLSIETHILDFNENIYGEKIKVYFLERMREEKKFNSLNELVEQLKKDKLYAAKQKLEISFKN